MELYENKSLVELLRSRRRLTETETRWYVAQLVAGLQHIHSQNIVHRDLKLGNLFLGSNMQLKIGDFGLSEKIMFEGDKLKSLSGTPNYIAPEILTDKTGHSFEVDIWAIGVIAYTLLVGIPPFQSKTSKATWSKIKQVAYSYPMTLNLSNESKDFIHRLLQKEPSHRLKLDEIWNHPFMQMPYPEFWPVSTFFEPIYESKRMLNMPPNAASRARSVAQLHRTVKDNMKDQQTDEENAEDFQEQVHVESTPYLSVNTL